MLRTSGKHSPKGILIAIEGIDGAGKTTQAATLRKHLTEMGLDVDVFKEPTMISEWGRKIASMGKEGRHLTAQEESRYFLEDRKVDVATNILPALNKGHIVIMDRYFYSNMAYQGAKGLKPEDIERENIEFAPRPQLVILLDISPATAKERIGNRRGESNHFEERLGPVRDIFQDIAQTHPEVSLVAGEIPEEEVERKIEELVGMLIPQYEK